MGVEPDEHRIEPAPAKSGEHARRLQTIGGNRQRGLPARPGRCDLRREPAMNRPDSFRLAGARQRRRVDHTLGAGKNDDIGCVPIEEERRDDSVKGHGRLKDSKAQRLKGVKAQRLQGISRNRMEPGDMMCIREKSRVGVTGGWTKFVTATTGIAAAIAMVVATASPAGAQGAQLRGALPQPLPLLPADNWWNLDISPAPVDDQQHKPH